MPSTPTPIVLHNAWALGDTVCLAAAVRDLHRAHPGRYRVSTSGHYTGFWKRCPDIAPLDPGRAARRIVVNYHAGIVASQAGTYRRHFLTWFHRMLGRELGVEVPVTEPRGAIWRAVEASPAAGRYWVVVAGGKLDMTAKWWPLERWQATVDALAARGIACVQAGAHFHKHVHPPLRNCPSAVGRTDDIHDLFALIAGAEGVLCGITAAAHIAAVYDKPCVVVAGGREEPWWEAYTNEGQWPAGCAPVRVPHRFLHTVGRLDCCKRAGCWKKRTVPIEPADTATAKGRANLCVDPIRAGTARPRCLDLIAVDEVVAAALSYYEDGTLPPPGAAAPTVSAPPPPAPAVVPPPAPAAPAALRAPRTAAEDPAFRALDHPAIGGKVTIFLLAYGDHLDFSRRAFESILATVPPARRDLRVALNQPGAATLAYFRGLAPGTLTTLSVDQGARRKYPAMRALFRDPERPIVTPYLVWFDDDTVCVDPLWLVRLAETIAANHRGGCRLYGARFYHDVAMYARGGHRPDAWFRAAPWWHNRDLRLRGQTDRTAPNGSVIEFVAGWFWALATATIAECDIPDARLNHNGGDIVVGAQVAQAGYRIKSFNEGKRHVYTPPRDQGGRRGFSEPFPWAP